MESTFQAEPMRLMLASIIGIALLLFLIIRFKLHPVISVMP